MTQNHAGEGWPPYDGIVKEHDKNGDEELTKEEVKEAWLAEHYGWLDHDGSGIITRKDWEDLGRVMTSDNWGAYAIEGVDKKEKRTRRWNYRKNVSEIASPLVYKDVFYMVEKGVLTTLDAGSGELLKRGRLGEGSPKVYASPIAANGKVYIGTLDGVMHVIKAGGEWDSLAQVDLDDEIWSTPAIADGSLFVRTRGKLFRFGK